MDNGNGNNINNKEYKNNGSIYSEERAGSSESHSHHSRSYEHTSGEHRSHRSSSYRGAKYIRTERYGDKDQSGRGYIKTQRHGENDIYKFVHRKKISSMARRLFFCILFLALIIFIVYSIFNADTDNGIGLKFRENDEKQHEMEKLEKQILDMEDYIYELEDRLSQYEDIEHKNF